MPYITNKTIESLNHRDAITAGELNYKITSCVLDYLSHDDMSYDRINTVIGALECAKLELYRRVAAPYENDKMRQNGDVYPKMP